MLRFKGIVIILFIQTMLYGCSAHVDDDLVEFVKEVKSKKTEAVEAMPPFPHAQNFKYTAANFRDPFEPFSAPKAEAPPAGGPNLNRAREPLEDFPLDSLLMVGTLEREGDFFALIKDNTGIVHMAQIGNYIGQNSGKIEKINESMIEVKEWLPNGKGGFKERVAVLPLVRAEGGAGS